MTKLVTLSLLMFLAVGCGEGVIEPSPHTVTISPPTLYAGGQLTVKGEGVRNRTHQGVWVGGDSLPLSVIAAARDSIVLALPADIRGRYTLRFGRARGPVIGEVEVAGFAGYRKLPFSIGYEPFVWPGDGEASVIGGSDWNSREVRLTHLESGTAEVLLSGYVPDRTPGRTPDPGVLLLQPYSTAGYGPLEAWEMRPRPRRLRTYPFEMRRRLAQFNDSTFINTFHHTTQLYRLRDSVMVRVEEQPYADIQEFIYAPGNDRATMRAYMSPGVYDMRTGNTLYRVEHLLDSFGAAFSAGGDTLWMLGSVSRYPAPRIALSMMAAADGRVLRQVVLPDHLPVRMALDRRTGRVYVATRPRDTWVLDVFVFRSRDLEPLGHIEVPRHYECHYGCDAALVVGTNGVFLAHRDEIFDFDLLK